MSDDDRRQAAVIILDMDKCAATRHDPAIMIAVLPLRSLRLIRP
jgi:hypothetical protein